MEQKYVLLYTRGGMAFCEIVPESKLQETIKMVGRCTVEPVTKEVE